MDKISKNNNNIERDTFCACGLENEWIQLGFSCDGPLCFWGCLECYKKKAGEDLREAMKKTTTKHDGSLVIPLGNYGEV